ncbi:hypothetical protein K443DRAFT_13950 [Laccaria amethystina LaAM-08-1]|uniref:Uncharacterized protein n=1 Tax=Laccaria amethystina LaAM-08-1 TaxID=1095629 RepID=A0A0C9X2Y1_9AGAR|nr:hypothetical protein K443DRAFT_13950 [Laccaria amethystina LaAM-08-1]
MSVATASLNDTLPSSIPKLDATGLNWAVFSLRFEDAVQAKGFWGHFSGTTPCPTATIESAPTADELAAIEKWEKARDYACDEVVLLVLVRFLSKKHSTREP